MVHTIISLVRTLFLFIDYTIYMWSAKMYNTAISFYDLDSIIDSSSIVNRTMSVVYSFLAIYMFFRLAVSLIEMLVDPGLIEDKNKGAGKLVTNVMITLVLIVAVPMAFRVCKSIQSTVIKEQVIEKAFYGNNLNDDAVNSVGDRLSLSVLSVFLYPNDDVSKTSETYKAWSEFFDVSSTRNTKYTWKISTLSGVINNHDFLTFDYDISYYIVVSTIAGLFLLWTMVKLCMDVAYRSLKMLVLEIISPIAIISYINPKSSKDGVFSKWLKETFKTYLSLFTRIAIYALASILLLEFSNVKIASGQFIKKLIYCIAIVALVNNGPKLLDGIFGTSIAKDEESKTLGNFLKSAIGLGAAGTTGALVGGISGAAVSNGNSLQKAWAFTKGALHGGATGVKKGIEGGKKGDVYRGVINSSLGTYNAVRKDFGLKEKEPFYKEKHDAEVNRFKNNYLDIVDNAKKTAGKNAKLDKNGNEAATMKDNIGWYNYTHEVRKDKSGAEYTLSFLYDNDDEAAYNLWVKGESVKGQNKGMLDAGIISIEGQKAYNFKTDAGIKSDLVSSIESYINSTLNRKMSMSVDEMKAELNIAPGTLISVEDVQKQFKTKIVSDLERETGCSVDIWTTISKNASSDSKSAENAVNFYEQTDKGKIDKRRRSIYDEADAKKKVQEYAEKNK